MRTIGVETTKVICAGAFDYHPASYERFGTQSPLHRGYYCPSPIYDVVIGNCKRGRILNSPTRSGAWFQYSFDEAGNLIYVKHPIGTRTPIIEYLFQNGDEVIGVTVDEYQKLHFVSIETYENGVLKDYKTALFAPMQGPPLWNFRCESYGYDNIGLRNANVVQLDFSCHSRGMVSTQSVDVYNATALYQANYQFERKDGYLSAYTTWSSWNGEPEKESHWPVTIRRKA